ncbi:MAG: hypothetical protein RI885_1464 [Actinomycetota bacterium]|jgi:alanine racemase
MPAPTLTIDQAAIASNTRLFVERASGSVMAVLKADSFGHGDQARLALTSGATSLGVTGLEEAFPLRAQGITVPILSWLNPVDADFAAAVRADIDIAVPSLEHLVVVASAARLARRTARIHLHIDLGMARDGAPREHWSPLCELARLLEVDDIVEVVGIMGHLSFATVPSDPRNDVETLLFSNAVRTARRRGLRPRVRHLAATAATLNAPRAHFDLSRIGAGLFGIDPSKSEPLRGAMTLTAPVVQIREVPAGTGVGYGHEEVTDRPTKLALLPIGYADGIPHSASGEAEVFVRNRRRRIIGRISMDQLVVDVGAETIQPGETVTVFGPGDRGEPTVADWARWSQTIEHEIVTGIGSRVTRCISGSVEASADDLDRGELNEEFRAV